MEERVYFDTGYKYLLSSKGIFVEMLRCFVKEDWVDQVDEKSLIRVWDSEISIHLNEPEDHIVYRIELEDRDVYFYVLMETQSTMAHWLPWRMLEYEVGILKDSMKYKRKNQLSDERYLEMPAIIPIVLYNGKSRWKGKQRYSESLGASEMFGKYVVDFDYILIDVHRYDEQELVSMNNLISSVFLLDQSFSHKEAEQKLDLVKHIFTQQDDDNYDKLMKWLKWFESKFYQSPRPDIIEMFRQLLDAGLLPADKTSEVTGLSLEQILDQKEKGK